MIPSNRNKKRIAFRPKKVQSTTDSTKTPDSTSKEVSEVQSTETAPPTEKKLKAKTPKVKAEPAPARKTRRVAAKRPSPEPAKSLTPTEKKASSRTAKVKAEPAPVRKTQRVEAKQPSSEPTQSQSAKSLTPTEKRASSRTAKVKAEPAPVRKTQRVEAKQPSSEPTQSQSAKSLTPTETQTPAAEKKSASPRPKIGSGAIREPRPVRKSLLNKDGKPQRTAVREIAREERPSEPTRKSEDSRSKSTSTPSSSQSPSQSRLRRQSQSTPSAVSKPHSPDRSRQSPKVDTERKPPNVEAEEIREPQRRTIEKTPPSRQDKSRGKSPEPASDIDDSETVDVFFKDLGLHRKVYKGVESKGHETPTPIQAKAIPVWLDGMDIVGSAQTGTGKTAAFALPMLSQLETWRDEGKIREVDQEAEDDYRSRSSGNQGRSRSSSRGRSSRAPQSSRSSSASVARPLTLIIEPTRELANQVLDAIREYGKFTSCKASVIYGGVGYGTQREELARNPEIIVATPGRLLDYVQQGEISLKSIRAVILDEADRMLDMGFLPDVRRILEACPPPHKRQTGFFSATLPPAIQTLVNWAAQDPVTVSVDPPKSTARTVKHALYPVAELQKSELLLALLEETHYDSVIVFCRTRRGADRVGKLMKQHKHPVGVLHSDHNQREREMALKKFRSGEYDALVATDIASRGLDIADVTHVINYDIPENPEDYVHRIGRTGRARASGDAFTLYTAQDAQSVMQIERFIETTIERKKVEGFNYRYTALFDEGKGDRPTLASGKFKSSRVRGGYVFGMSSRRRKR